MEFRISPEGLLFEASVRDAAEADAERFSLHDSLAIEAARTLVRAYHASVSVSEVALAKFGVTSSKVAILALLYRSDQRQLSIGEIARAREMSSANASKLVDALVASGLVLRMANPEDGRSSLVQLTQQGAIWVEEILPGTHRPVIELWSWLTDDEKRVMIHLLTKLRIRAAAKSMSISEVQALVPAAQRGRRRRRGVRAGS